MLRRVTFFAIALTALSIDCFAAANADVIAARGRVSSYSQPLYGGFHLVEPATVYILVRGNSLKVLGVTQDYLDAPRVRLYDAQGADLFSDGRPGFGDCLPENPLQASVMNHYQTVRTAPVDPRDACLAISLGGGVYTFDVRPSYAPVTALRNRSSPEAGEVLFEVTLNP